MVALASPAPVSGAAEHSSTMVCKAEGGLQLQRAIAATGADEAGGLLLAVEGVGRDQMVFDVRALQQVASLGVASCVDLTALKRFPKP